MNLYRSQLCAALTTITFVWLLFFTKACIFLRPSLVSFLPTPFVPPYKTTTYFFVSFSLSSFAVFIKVCTPVPGFTKLLTLCYTFEEKTFARLPPIIIILCFFFSDTCHFLQFVSLFTHLFACQFFPSIHP